MSKLVLIVDDVRPLAEQYAYDLRRLGGFRTRVVASGAEGLDTLSREVVERLRVVEPATLGQAARVPGVTPAAVAVLGAYVKRWGRSGSERAAMEGRCAEGGVEPACPARSSRVGTGRSRGVV